MNRTMKDSGIPWIGEIPEGWRQSRMKNYFHLHGRIGWKGLRSEEFEEQSYAYLVTGQDFCSKNIDWNKCYQINKERYDEDEYIQLVEGDILVTKDGTIGKIAVVSNLDKPACLNSGIFVVKQYDPKQFNPGYLYWLLVSPLLKTFNEFLNLGGTTIIHLYQNVFERMPIVAPPLAEQHLIATFLDKKCSEIDSLIELQEQMIEELKAYKQSVITEAVTKGLNPNVPMKDSGIPWIGEIPEGWKVCFIKQIMRNKSIKGYPCETVLSLYRDYGVVPKDSRSDNHNVTSEDTSSYKFVEVGDFVINKMKAWQGSMAVSNYQGIISPAYYICRFTTDSVDREYVHYLLRNETYKVEYMRLSSGLRIGQWDLNIDDFLRVKMVLPSLAEQQAIADYLDRKCGEIDELITIKQQKIESLKEYKKSVIYEYVTGKREV